MPPAKFSLQMLRMCLISYPHPERIHSPSFLEYLYTQKLILLLLGKQVEKQAKVCPPCHTSFNKVSGKRRRALLTSVRSEVPFISRMGIVLHGDPARRVRTNVNACNYTCVCVVLFQYRQTKGIRMNTEIWIQIGGFAAVLSFLWRISQDTNRQIADLRERMAKLEGAFEGFLRGQQKQNG